MNFTEARFVPFLLAVYVLWLLCGGHRRLRLGVLLGASLIFYGSSRWPLLLLLLTYCVVDWAVGCWIARSRRPKLPLTLGVAFNLIVLGYWKYTPLLLRTLAPLWHGLGLADLPPTDHWQIPFGISFYTFTGIAYLVDVYRHGIAPETNLARFTLYKTFFPQLVAGPILRPAEFLADLQPDRLPCRPLALQEALWLLARGAFKKMVLADRIALAVDPFFVHMADPSTAGVWSLPYVWLYALQIYFDFSGYTDMARGLGLLFGFRWPDNFNLPYLAGSVQEFWQRWHITLSRFLRDYLYIPLGGSHCGRVRTHVNLMLTMLLGGLWHGAHWTFLLWGGLHGSFLILHRLWSERPLRARLQALTGPAGFAWRLACLVLTFHAVCLAWCFFRLNVLAQSMACVRQWFVFERGKLFAGGSGELSLWLLLGLYGSLAWLVRGGVRLPLPAARPSLGALARGFVWGAGVALLVLAVLLSPGGEKVPFIYFQF